MGKASLVMNLVVPGVPQSRVQFMVESWWHQGEMVSIAGVLITTYNNAGI